MVVVSDRPTFSPNNISQSPLFHDHNSSHQIEARTFVSTRSVDRLRENIAHKTTTFDIIVIIVITDAQRAPPPPPEETSFSSGIGRYMYYALKSCTLILVKKC